MQKKEVNINNFIGVYDGYITEEECKKAIKLFEQQNTFEKTMNRQSYEKASVLYKQDQQLFMNHENITVWHEDLKVMIANFDMALKEYLNRTDIQEFHPQFHYTTMKIQKTLPKEGYHIWHTEWGPGMGYEGLQRALVYSIYLNDVEEGGETEFLHFSQRVQPKTGRIVIWPAAFPYVHRGNPPLSGEKYMLTSWLLINGQ